jgi:hypothetical protein
MNSGWFCAKFYYRREDSVSFIEPETGHFLSAVFQISCLNFSIMKSLLVAFFCLFVFLVNAQPPDVPADAGTSFGSTTTADGAVNASELSNFLSNKESGNIKVIAKVVDVCPKKGCWVSLEMADKSTVMVKMKDYGFFVPLKMIGKTVVVDGVAKKITTSVDELKHYAEDAKKSKEEIAAITSPKEEIRLTATGILVVK